MPIPRNYSTPTRKTAKDQAYQQIQEWIIDGTFEPGEKLNEAKLAEAMGTSRTPVREALQTLQAEGFIEIRPGKETKVTEIADEDISKIFPILAAMQSLAAELATPLMDKQTIDSLRSINDNFAQSVEAGDSYSSLKNDQQFHQIIIDLLNNPYLSAVVSTMQAHCQRLYFHKSIVPSRSSIGEHNEIIRAFEEKDKDKAARIMRQNFWRPMEEYYAQREIE